MPKKLQVTPIEWQQICCNLASTKSPEKFIPSPPSTGIPARWHERTMAVFSSSIESQKSTAANNRIWAAASMRRKRPQARAVICWPVTIKILAKTASSVSDNTRSVYKAVSTIDGSEPCQGDETPDMVLDYYTPSPDDRALLQGQAPADHSPRT